MANDAMNRKLDRITADPLYNATTRVHLQGQRVPRMIGPQDLTCFNGVNEHNTDEIVVLVCVPCSSSSSKFGRLHDDERCVDKS